MCVARPNLNTSLRIAADDSHRFLLPALQIQAVLERTSRAEIRRTIQSLPTELGNTFSTTLDRIRRQPRSRSELAMRTLMWISHARRPLTVEELRQAIAVIPGTTSFDPDNICPARFIVGYCLGLVTIDDESSTIRLVHFSLQEYLVKLRRNLFPIGNDGITEICLTYLLYDFFSVGPAGMDEDLEMRIVKFPFLPYAGSHWGDHLRGGSGSADEMLALSLLDDNAKLLGSIQVAYCTVSSYTGHSQSYPRLMAGLHVVATFGLEGVPRVLLERGTEIDATDGDGWTALHWAAWNGHDSVVRLLLDQGADGNATDDNEGTALHGAAAHGHAATVSVLMEKVTDLEARYGNEETALYRAVSNGHVQVAVLLLDKSTDVEAVDGNGWTALYRAASEGYVHVVRLLLERGAKVDISNEKGWTPLH